MTPQFYVMMALLATAAFLSSLGGLLGFVTSNRGAQMSAWTASWIISTCLMSIIMLASWAVVVLK